MHSVRVVCLVYSFSKCILGAYLVLGMPLEVRKPVRLSPVLGKTTTYIGT